MIDTIKITITSVPSRLWYKTVFLFRFSRIHCTNKCTNQNAPTLLTTDRNIRPKTRWIILDWNLYRDKSWKLMYWVCKFSLDTGRSRTCTLATHKKSTRPHTAICKGKVTLKASCLSGYWIIITNEGDTNLKINQPYVERRCLNASIKQGHWANQWKWPSTKDLTSPTPSNSFLLFRSNLLSTYTVHSDMQLGYYNVNVRSHCHKNWYLLNCDTDNA